MGTTPKKVVSVALSVTTGVWMSGAMLLVPVAAHAQTTAELQAQISALLAQIQALQAQLSGGAAVSCSFTRDLTVGATGEDVRCLQQYLNSAGHQVAASGPGSPGNETTTFGPLSRAAVSAWQAAQGVSPSVGYFGSLSRAKYNALAAAAPAPAPAPGVPSAPAAVSTPGVEAIITAEYAPAPANNPKVGEGETAGVLGVRIKSKQGDAVVERVKIDLGTSSTFYNKIAESLSLYDGSTLLASVALNSSTVVRETGPRYTLTFTGFSILVPKDGQKDLTINATMRSTIDSGDFIASTVFIPTDGVRARDGAGIDQFAPSAALANRTVTAEAGEGSQGSLTVSKNSGSPKPYAIVGDTDGDVDLATMLIFDVKASSGRVKITDVVATLATDNATMTTLYLYQGSTLIASSVAAATTAFTDLTDLYVNKDQTVTFTFKADFDDATGSSTATQSVDISALNLTAENDDLDALTAAERTGSAAGDVHHVSGRSPVATLVSKSIAYTGPTQAASGTLTGTFVFDLRADGGDVQIAKTGAFDVNAATGTSSSSGAGNSESVVYTAPTNVTTGTNAYKIAEDSTARFTVTMTTVADTDVPISENYNYVMRRLIWHTADEAVGTNPINVDYLDKDEWRTNNVFVQK